MLYITLQVNFNSNGKGKGVDNRNRHRLWPLHHQLEYSYNRGVRSSGHTVFIYLVSNWCIFQPPLEMFGIKEFVCLFCSSYKSFGSNMVYYLNRIMWRYLAEKWSLFGVVSAENSFFRLYLPSRRRCLEVIASLVVIFSLTFLKYSLNWCIKCIICTKRIKYFCHTEIN